VRFLAVRIRSTNLAPIARHGFEGDARATASEAPSATGGTEESWLVELVSFDANARPEGKGSGLKEREGQARERVARTGMNGLISESKSFKSTSH
jgi:hypothetical protein